MARKNKARKYTADEITKMVDEKRNTAAYSEMFDQFEADFDLYSLKKYEAEEGHQSYTSPKPRNDFLKVFNGINKASLTWQIVTAEDAPEDERKSASKGEELLTGILDRADRALRKVGEPPLREGLGWFACGRGAAGLKCLIYSNEQKENEIDIRPLDPLHMAWERGQDGLVWAAFEYVISKAEAKDRYGVEITGEDATIIDFFDREINAVVLSSGAAVDTGSEFVKEPTPHRLGHVPVFIGFAGGMPSVYRKDNTPTLKYRAASVYASSRNIYEPFNRQVSFVMDVSEKSVAGTLLHKSKDGRKTLKGDPFASWTVINVEEGEEIRPLEPPKVPPESGVILSILDRDKQESTVPYPIGYGLDPQAHSGAALAMINDNTRSIYDPFASLIESAYRWLCEEILSQFKEKGQKMTLQGFNQEGKYFRLEASASDIKDDWYIQVKCEPKLPRDEAGELQMALNATQARPPFGRPLISDYTAREKILKLQNPDAEDTRIEEQQIRRMIEQIPQVQLRRVANELLEKGDRQGAMELLASLPGPGQPGQQAQTPGGALERTPATLPGPGNSQIPRLTPQQLEQVAQMAAQLKAQGREIPPEMAAALQQAENMPAPRQ